LFLQNLPKEIAKLLERFKKVDFKSIFINNFRDIVIIFVSMWVVVMAIVLLVVLNGRNSGNENRAAADKKALEKQRDIESKKETLGELLLNADDFVLPESRSVDLTNDFVDLLPKKKFELPDKSFIKKENEKLLKKETEESLKFNFEKRKAKE
jgi:hypothetical protein